MKLSARQVLDAPLPADRGAWSLAVRRLRAGDVEGCGRALAAGEPKLLEWWLRRLPAPRTV